MIGQTFGKLTVTSKADDVIYIVHGKPSKTRRWNCVCVCGGETTSFESGLKSGNSTSCGCKRRKHAIKMGKARTTHGMSCSKEYSSYHKMMQRCYSKNSDQYKNYGNRGIVVCDKWKNSFDSFLSDMGMAPSENHSVDRINPNGNYEKENCRWATWKEQQRNRTNNRVIKIYGEEKTLAEWCEIYETSYAMVHKRITKCGIDPLVALSTKRTSGGKKLEHCAAAIEAMAEYRARSELTRAEPDKWANDRCEKWANDR